MMHVFFFITTLVVIVIAVAIGCVGWRLWQILGHVEKLSRSVSDESDLIRQDIAHARDKFAKGAQIAAITGLAASLGKRAMRARTAKKKRPSSLDIEPQ